MQYARSLIVDGTNLVMRSVKAGEATHPSGKLKVHLSFEIEGEEVTTTGPFLFINTLARYVREVEPDRMVVCWDGGRSKYRSAIYPEYKGERKERVGEDDTSYAFHLSKQFLSLNGIHHVEVPETEADDLVAAYARAERDRGNEVVILSGDKDFLQLLAPNVTQIRPGVKPEHWTVDDVIERIGCHPNVLPLVMALTGDKVDGVPGIPGFGNKTAIKYGEKYNWNWAALIDAAESGEDKKIAGKQDDILRNLALVNLRLVIDRDLEGGFVPEFGVHPETAHEVVEWLGLYGFDSILNRFRAGTLWRDHKQGTLL